ncbi:AAA family ATPase [Virgibacillus sp. NKC19-3]|uniref:AAA family ATPase n=1 Tax=Virgibacillus saliphilus TaxID=2831674 RepID=UPI001C9B7726|nr:AAA family ATPase [Virgibacillus sp. NKC19-3]MBY7141734.1 AAA family ATPase [Virgibacillus sp. NKC19-3]
MNSIIIYYGSKNEFDKVIPESYRTLTDVVYETDKDRNKHVIFIPGVSEESSEEDRLFVENFVVTSDEYAGVREHVIINFNNFLGKFDTQNIYLHNPPLQISDQIIRLYPETKIEYQDYSAITLDNLIEINSEYDTKIIGQENVKLNLLQSLFPITLEGRKKPVVILMYGKSGIGKTETAKFISKVIGEPLFRKQFSMYQNNQFATYLFGGAHYEKSFAKDLLDRESNVLLLDEFDKAHPSFHSAFYQLFDEGIYEDQNYYLNLDKAIIICTSNYNNLNEIEEHLGSPIYNRFDKIIHFDDLSNEAKQKIGKELYTNLSSLYKNKISDDVEHRLFGKFIECDNVRQIHHLIEDTFALSAVLENVEKK